jgi:hypothetical protein
MGREGMVERIERLEKGLIRAVMAQVRGVVDTGYLRLYQLFRDV